MESEGADCDVVSADGIELHRSATYRCILAAGCIAHQSADANAQIVRAGSDDGRPAYLPPGQAGKPVGIVVCLRYIDGIHNLVGSVIPTRGDDHSIPTEHAGHLTVRYGCQEQHSNGSGFS